MKSLVIFDLDGTLAESKTSLYAEMATLLARLLEVVRVAVISGGAWPQFETQVLSCLHGDESIENLSLLPTCGTKFYRYSNGWQRLYSEDFSVEEKNAIIHALNAALDQSGFKEEQHWGDSDRRSWQPDQISALGQQAPLEAKEEMGPRFQKA